MISFFVTIRTILRKRNVEQLTCNENGKQAEQLMFFCHLLPSNMLKPVLNEKLTFYLSQLYTHKNVKIFKQTEE